MVCAFVSAYPSENEIFTTIVPFAIIAEKCATVISCHLGNFDARLASF